MSRNPTGDNDFRSEICAWLQANGVNPNHTPMQPRARIADGKLTLLQKVQRNGHDVIDETGYDVLKETITVPLVAEPSPEIAEWMRTETAA